MGSSPKNAYKSKTINHYGRFFIKLENQRKSKYMECIYCKCHMVKKTAPFSIQKNGYYLHWDAIPAFVCDQCGEAYFAEHEVDVIQSAILELDRKNSEFNVMPEKEAA